MLCVQIALIFCMLLWQARGLTGQYAFFGNGDLGSLNSTTMRWLKKSSAKASEQFWVEGVNHNGQVTYNPSPSSYKVFRNVKDYGAVGE